MSRRKPGGMVLRWNQQLIEELVAVGPPNQTRILAVGAAMISHCNADGTRMEAGLRRLAAETGQRHGRVGEALKWMEDNGWLKFEQRIARGGRRFTLTIPQRPGTGHAEKGAQRPGTGHAEHVVSVRSVSGQRPGTGHEPPTSVKEGGGEATDGLPATVAKDTEGKKETQLLVDKWHDYVWWLFTSKEHLGEWFSFAEHIDGRDLDLSNSDFVAELRRLKDWSREDFVNAWRPPKKEVDRVTGWVIQTLRGFPDDPNDDARIRSAQRKANR